MVKEVSQLHLEIVPSSHPISVQHGDIFQLGWHRVMCGDATHADDVARLMQGECVDACITDPPYPREYSYVYKGVASLLPDILRRGGSFLAIVPHYLLPEVLHQVNEHLKYRWIMSMWQANGSHPRMAMGIEVMWKPIVWWVNGTWPRGRGFVKDGFENIPVKKNNHIWEQSVCWADYCLKFVPTNGTIFEPFLGGGTTLISCENNNMRCYAMEIDPDACQTSIQRWQQHTGQSVQLIQHIEECQAA